MQVEFAVCSSGINNQQSVRCHIIKGASLSCLSVIDDHKGQLTDQLMSCQRVG